MNGVFISEPITAKRGKEYVDGYKPTSGYS